MKQANQDSSGESSNQTAEFGNRDLFTRAATAATRFAGGRWAFTSAFLIVILWAACGPYFNYSDHWQIVINTGTTIVTFLMVFLIQNTQNRESKALHIKLDELIHALKHASNSLINAENLSEQDLDILASRYARLAEMQHQAGSNGAQKSS